MSSITLVIAKYLADERFKSWTLSKKIAYILPASIFPITSPRPDQTSETNNIFTRKVKASSSELMFLFIFHAVNLMVCILIFFIMLLTSPDFSATIAKVEEVSGFPLQLAVFCGCPVAWLLSVCFRLIYNYCSPWSAINDLAKCSALCPPLPRSQFTTEEITITGLNKTEDTAAEIGEMLAYLADERL